MLRRDLWVLGVKSLRRSLLSLQPAERAIHSQARNDVDIEKEYAEGRRWKAEFDNEKFIEKVSGLADLRFDRASGAGGQNVNKYVLSL